MTKINKICVYSAFFLFAAGASLSASASEHYRTGAEMRARLADGSESVIPAGSSVTLLESSADGTMAHFGVDSDDESVPAEAWVSLENVALMKLDLDTSEDETGLEDNEVPSFLEDAARGLGRGRGGMTYCYRGVKQYLLAHHMVKVYLPGASAYKAYDILPHYGFHKVAEKPAQAKLNDVCVYHGGRGGNGHIEVRVNGGWSYGYGVIPHPIRNHPFLGCFRKN